MHLLGLMSSSIEIQFAQFQMQPLQLEFLWKWLRVHCRLDARIISTDKKIPDVVDPSQQPQKRKDLLHLRMAANHDRHQPQNLGRYLPPQNNTRQMVPQKDHASQYTQTQSDLSSPMTLVSTNMKQSNKDSVRQCHGVHHSSRGHPKQIGVGRGQPNYHHRVYSFSYTVNNGAVHKSNSQLG